MDTDEGIAGWGEAYNHGPDCALPPVLEYLYPQIEGIDPRRIEFIYQKLLQSSRFPPGAIGLAAISALEHALWDISGKAAGLPVYMLLGGNVRDRVRVYCGVYTAPDPQDCWNGRRRCTSSTASPRSSSARIGATCMPGAGAMLCAAAGEYFGELRAICPAEFEFAFDAHAKIFEPYQAIQLGNALAPHDPLFFEEPIRPEHIPAWGRLRAGLKAPLATGECLYSRFEFLSAAGRRRGGHHPAGYLRRRRAGGDAADRRAGGGAFRDGGAAQPDGAAGDGGERAFLRGAAELQDPGIQAAGTGGVGGRSLSAARRPPGAAAGPAGLGHGDRRARAGAGRLHPLGAQAAAAAGRVDRLHLMQRIALLGLGMAVKKHAWLCGTWLTGPRSRPAGARQWRGAKHSPGSMGCR